MYYVSAFEHSNHILYFILAWREYETNRLKEDAKKKKQEAAKARQIQAKENTQPTQSIQSTAIKEETGGKRPLDAEDDDFRPTKLPRKLQQTDSNKPAIEIEVEGTQKTEEFKSEKEPKVKVPKIFVGSRT